MLGTVGLVMLFSASMVRYENSGYFIVHQLYWMLVALVAAVVCARIDLQWVRKLALPAAAICLVALVLVLVPGIGHRIKGSARWI
ncbi:MAG TPA: FtsW/RodA/SpoVE family cell cycle protein, partial [Tichowtungia sp.]|nr:FtsW/RodA/SpoVE family cell cycle protein [Tichowtungia sp.]